MVGYLSDHCRNIWVYHLSVYAYALEFPIFTVPEYEYCHTAIFKVLIPSYKSSCSFVALIEFIYESHTEIKFEV